MTRPSQDAIDTFISITSASESVAIQMLEGHDGDLNRAVDAYFNDGDRSNASTNNNTLAPAQNDYMDTDDIIEVDIPVQARSTVVPSLMNPFSLLNTTFDRIFDGGPSEYSNRMPHASHPRERRKIPIEFKEPLSSSSDRPVIEEISDDSTEPSHGPENHGNVVMDDDIPPPQSDDIEEEMLRAAIEASKRDAEVCSKQQIDVSDDDITTDIDVVGKGSVKEEGGTSVVGEDASANNNGERFAMEWGGISSEEHDEAVMLEAAMFGGVPEGAAAASYDFRYPRVVQPPRPPSPSLTAQRLLREQQDDEYQAALVADREKTLRRSFEEAAAKQETLRKLREDEEFEGVLAAKQASLPAEPSSDDDTAVTLLVRMPDGTRYGRRFIKSDNLQSLFDYIDIGRAVKPGTYRLVRPYPRRTFNKEDCASTLTELGLINKQEALFLELI